MAAYGAYPNIILCMEHVAYPNSIELLEKNLMVLLIEPLGRVYHGTFCLGGKANRPVAKSLAQKIRLDNRADQVCRTKSRKS